MTVLDVDPPRLAGSGAKVSAAGDTLAAAVQALGSTLSSSGQMCGNDLAGKAFAETYRRNGQALFSAAEAAVNAARKVGHGIEVSASNYARSEAASTLGGGTPSVPSPADPAKFSGPVMPNSHGPAVSQPMLWAFVSQFVGSPWPDGNPATLRTAAAAWRTFGSAVAGVNGDLSAGTAALSSQDIPESGQINGAVLQLSSGLCGLGVCESIASSLESFAGEIESSQQAIRDLLDRFGASGILEELGSIFTGHDPLDDVEKVADDIKQVLQTLNREADGSSAMFDHAMNGLDSLTTELENWERKQFTHFLGDDVGNRVADVVTANLDLSEGATKSVFQTVGGLQELVTHPQDLAKAVIESNPVTMATQFATDPKGFIDNQIYKAKGLLDTKDWSSDHPLRGLGNNLGNIVQLVVPGLGEVKGAAATGRVADEAGQAARAEAQAGRVGEAAGADAGSDIAAQGSKIKKDLNAIDYKHGQPVSASSVKFPEPGPVTKPDVPAAPRRGEALPGQSYQHVTPDGGVREPAEPAAERPTPAPAVSHANPEHQAPTTAGRPTEPTHAWLTESPPAPTHSAPAEGPGHTTSPRPFTGHHVADEGNAEHLAPARAERSTEPTHAQPTESPFTPTHPVPSAGPGHGPSEPVTPVEHPPVGEHATPGAHDADTEGPAGHPTPQEPVRLTDEEFARHREFVADKVREALSDGLATEQQHFLLDRDEWPAEREALHKQLVNDLWDRLGADEVPNDHRALVAGGLPGAGKTTTLSEFAGIRHGEYLVINPDDVKSLMAEHGLIPKVDGLSPMEASALVHEESSAIAKDLAERAMAEGKNIMWDITMGSCTSVESRLAALREMGYTHIDSVFVDIPLETSMERVAERFRRGVDDYLNGTGYGGRYVPEDGSISRASQQYYSRNREVFEALRDQFDNAQIWDNSRAGLPPERVD